MLCNSLAVLKKHVSCISVHCIQTVFFYRRIMADEQAVLVLG